MKITREKVEQNLDTVVTVLNFLQILVGGKGGKALFAAEVVAQMAKEALESLDDRVAGEVTSEAVRAHLKSLEDRLAANDAKADEALDAKFDLGED